MKKLTLILSVIFITMSSFTNTNMSNEEIPDYCDDLALFWYNTILNNGGGQAAATQAYQSNLAGCFLLGGDTDLEVDIP